MDGGRPALALPQPALTTLALHKTMRKEGGQEQGQKSGTGITDVTAWEDLASDRRLQACSGPTACLTAPHTRCQERDITQLSATDSISHQPEKKAHKKRRMHRPGGVPTALNQLARRVVTAAARSLGGAAERICCLGARHPTSEPDIGQRARMGEYHRACEASRTSARCS
eukprot:2312614-Rhodomonas_salina.6